MSRCGVQALPLIGTTLRVLTSPIGGASEDSGDGDATAGDVDALAVHREDDGGDEYVEPPPPPPPPRPPPSSGGGYAEPRARPAGFAIGGRARNGPNVRSLGGA